MLTQSLDDYGIRIKNLNPMEIKIKIINEGRESKSDPLPSLHLTSSFLSLIWNT